MCRLRWILKIPYSFRGCLVLLCKRETFFYFYAAFFFYDKETIGREYRWQNNQSLASLWNYSLSIGSLISMFIYIHIAHRMQTMRRGRCNRRLWCLREVQRLERQNEPLLDVNLSMMKKHLFLCGIEYAKENKLRSYIQHVWLKAASLVHFDAKAVVRWEVEKKKTAGAGVSGRSHSRIGTAEDCWCEKTQINCFRVCVAESAPIRDFCGVWISWSLHRKLDSVFILKFLSRCLSSRP